MENQKSRWWIFWSFLAVLIITSIILGYKYTWTGFNFANYPKDESYDFVPAKTLWDWLDLLIVPTVLAIVAYLFNRSEKKTEREKTIDQQRETALQTYFNHMTELLLDKGLTHKSSTEGEAVESPREQTLRSIARARTLTVLRSLDGERKRQVVQFLLEAKLIGARDDATESALIDISGADLSNARLTDLNLEGLWLKDIDVRGADFSRSILKDMYISGSTKLDPKWEKVLDIIQNQSYFLEADLKNTDLTNANFENIDFGKSDLRGANFSGALIKNAIFQRVQLDKKTRIANRYFDAWKIITENKSSLYRKPVDFTGKDFNGVNFADIILKNPNFQSANLSGTNFSNSSMIAANFCGADLMEANFTGAILCNADFSKSKLALTDFTGADLSESNFFGISTFLAEFENSNLTKSRFENADLSYNNMKNAILVSANLTSTKLKNVNLCHANLRDSILRNADLTEADLTGANLENADLTHCFLQNVKTDGETVIASKWIRVINITSEKVDSVDADNVECDVSNANFESIQMENINFSKANLSNTILRNAKLQNVSCVGASFRSADLRGANLSKVNLQGADFSLANLQNVHVDQYTHFDNKWAVVRALANNVVRGLSPDDTRRDISGKDLSEVCLADSYLQKMNFNDVSFRESILTGADLRFSSLCNADLEGAQLLGANLEGADLRGADLTGVDMGGVRYLGSLIDSSTKLDHKWRSLWEVINGDKNRKIYDGVDFSGADLSGLNFYYSSFKGANFTNTQMTWVKFGECDFQNVDFHNAKITNGVFIRCNMKNANFDNASIYWSSFNRSSWLQRSMLEKAKDLVGVKLPNGKKY